MVKPLCRGVCFKTMEREKIIRRIYDLAFALISIPKEIESAKKLEDMFVHAFEKSKLRIFPEHMSGFDAANYSALLEQEEVDFLRDRVLSRMSEHKERANRMQQEFIAEIRELLNQLEEIEL